MVTYIHIAPGWGPMSPNGPYFSESLTFSPTAYSCKIFTFDAILTIFLHLNA